MCCFCIPLRYGIVIIGIYLIFDAFQSLGQAESMKSIAPLVFIFFMLSLFPAVIAIYIYIKYFMQEDCFDNRKHLSLACGLMIASTLIQYIGIVLGALLVESIPVQSIFVFLIADGLNILNYIYFFLMCEMWAGLYSGETAHLLGASQGAQGANLWGGAGGTGRGGGTFMSGGPVGSAYGDSAANNRGR